MRTTTFFLLLTYITTICACKKENNLINEQPSYGIDAIETEDHVFTYSQLKVGNYWIYQEYELDSTGTIATPTTVYDSCYIKTDTIIRGNTYYKITAPPFTTFFNNFFIRDSADCIVRSTGEVEFSLSNFSTELYSTAFLNNLAPADTLYTASVWMKDKNKLITIPAGTFPSINSQIKFHMFPPINTAGTYRYGNRIFAPNVGMILTTSPFYASVSGYKELRLVRYHLN